MTCTSGCNYSLCTPDDGCGRHPKLVEWLGSKINEYLELHLVGCLKHKVMMHGNANIKKHDNKNDCTNAPQCYVILHYLVWIKQITIRQTAWVVILFGGMLGAFM